MTRKRQNIALSVLKTRPMPPDSLFDPSNWVKRLVPADGVSEWVAGALLREDSPLHNPDHKHLFFADVGYLWAGVGNMKQQRRVVGQCEQVTFRCSGWQRARQEQQIEEWFGHVPAFLITLDAHYAKECSDIDWCSLIEHELYHIGQQIDAFGGLAFTKDGLPKLGIRGHDVEEFTGIVRRYGAGAAAGDTAKLVEAARRPAEVGHVAIAQACGTCMLRAA